MNGSEPKIAGLMIPCEGYSPRFIYDWQPINTAPTDGTEILVFCPGMTRWQRALDGEIVIAAWQSGTYGRGAWFSDSSSSMEGYEYTGDYVVHDPVHPTHWMPLPNPPTKEPTP